MRYLAAILVLSFLAPASLACSCARRNFTALQDRADLVFAGRIESVSVIDDRSRSEPRIIVKFSVGRVWKGDAPADFSMHTYEEFSSCRGFFGELAQPGEELFVFARKGSARDWKANGVAPGADGANAYTVTDPRDRRVVLRQDLVDAVPADATIYTTDICSGTARWSDMSLVAGRLGAWHAPKGALVMNDPPPFDFSRLPPELRELPEVCWSIRGARHWKALATPPPEGADFEHELRRTPEYPKVMSGSIGQAKDFWWRDETTGAAGLCRLMHPDPRHCGALGAVFEKGKIVEAESEPCASGPM